ncbi:MAG: hypothetical protein WCD02_15905 [Terriglobales bacterium]
MDARQTQAMICGSKILAVMLIAAIAVAPLAMASAKADAPSPIEHPASCHMHDGNTRLVSHHPSPPHSPRPVPTNYQCCLTGHNTAVVQSTYGPRPCAGSTRVTQLEPSMTECFSTREEVSIVLHANPPGSAPLRI